MGAFDVFDASVGIEIPPRLSMDRVVVMTCNKKVAHLELQLPSHKRIRIASPTTTTMRSFTRNPGARRILRQCTSSPVCAAPPARTARPALAQPQHRLFHAASLRLKKQQAPPAERPPADLNDLNVLGNTPAPSTSVDVCTYDGFGLNSGITFTGGTGALLVNGEAFAWRPWEAKGSMELLNSKGQVDIPAEAFAMFGLLWPRPGASIPIDTMDIH